MKNFEGKKEEKEVSKDIDALAANAQKVKSAEEGFEERLKRMQADFENLKKITERQMVEAVCYSNEELVKKLLHILDSFDSAIKNIKNEDDKKGVLMIKEQLLKTLKESGLSEADVKNKKFDPGLCEALLAEESKEAEDTVLDVIQKGYIFKNRVIRHAKVKIAKPKTEENKNGN